ncbi:hypothetical protein [Cupriavidus sp. DL-D2]|uniref:hypothetical protein n=1 Tax=Cupriavidus sp. DL-D2 TaxID=3144974 RepID=UPI00321277D7
MPSNSTQSFPAFPGWPMAPFAFPQFAQFPQVPQFTAPLAASLTPFNPFVPFDNTVLNSWYKFVGLNTDFAKSMSEEAQFDWASLFVPQDPEDLYARQLTNQIPFLSIPLHYATSMMELGAATQRAWVDAWGHLLNLPVLTATTESPENGVKDVPAAQVRETPRSRKERPH